MKTSELISRLQAELQEKGDKEIIIAANKHSYKDVKIVDPFKIRGFVSTTPCCRELWIDFSCAFSCCRCGRFAPWLTADSLHPTSTSAGR